MVASLYRPRFGRWLSAAIWALCAYGILIAAADGGIGAAGSVAPWLLLASGTVWAAMWRPQVSVDDAGVHLVNVLRTIDLPWPSIQRIDTKWALELVTAYGSYTAWAAPAPSLRSVVAQSRDDVHRLPPSTYSSGGGIRPGDLPDSPSGAAALAVRTRWEALRDAGHLDDPRLEFQRVPVTWHLGTIAGGVLLLSWVALTQFIP